MDEQYLKTPQYGSRSYAKWFLRQAIMTGRKKRQCAMNEDSEYISTALKPRTSIPGKQQRYSVSLKSAVIDRPTKFRPLTSHMYQ